MASKPVEPKPATVKPVEPKSVASKPVEPKSVASKPVEPKPVASKPVEPKTIASKPAPAGAAATTTVAKPAASNTVKVRISAIPFDDSFIRIDGGKRLAVPWSGELTPGTHTVVAICEGIAEPYELKTELQVEASDTEINAAWRCQDRRWYKP